MNEIDPYSKINWKDLYKDSQNFNPDDFENDKDLYVVCVNDIKFANHYYNTRTLNVLCVQDEEMPENGLYIKHHEDTGWTIIGKCISDYYHWVDEFEAHHPIHGMIFGSFNKKVYAESKECFDNFVSSHHYEEWNMQDI